VIETGVQLVARQFEASGAVVSQETIEPVTGVVEGAAEVEEDCPCDAQCAVKRGPLTRRSIG
jgi:hypothetical protein